MNSQLHSPAAEMSAEQLAALSNAELLQLIQLLETNEVGMNSNREYDHRRYLERHELERIFCLLRWLRRSRGTAAEIVLPKTPSALPTQVVV